MTTTTDLAAAPEPTLIKTDVLGRLHRTLEQRQRILDEYERSGLSGPKFAALCGVKYQTFASWLQRGKRPRNHPRRKAAAPIQWLEASMPPDAAGAGDGLVLQLPGGVRAQLTNPGQVKLAAALVRALEQPC
jgi:hypothetical protein